MDGAVVLLFFLFALFSVTWIAVIYHSLKSEVKLLDKKSWPKPLLLTVMVLLAVLLFSLAVLKYGAYGFLYSGLVMVLFLVIFQIVRAVYWSNK